MIPETISEWADRKIKEETNESLFFGLSPARTTNIIIELLNERVSWNYNDKEIRAFILSYYKEYLTRNQNNWFEIEKELLYYFQLLEYDDSNEILEDFLYYLADDWNLRKDGFSGLLTMPEYLTDNLREYNDYNKLRELLKRQGLSGYEV